MKVFYSFLLCFIFCQLQLHAQSLTLIFRPELSGEPLVIGQSYNLDSSAYQFDKLKFYIGNFNFSKDGILKHSSSTYYLIDLENSAHLAIELDNSDIGQFNEIQFTLGVDSAVNYGGVKGGCLDPTQGMYWTWQNGYINFKIEGTKLNALHNKREFQYHLGGFLKLEKSEQLVLLKVKPAERLTIAFDLEAFLVQIENDQEMHVMSPGPKAITYMELLKSCFYLKE